MTLETELRDWSDSNNARLSTTSGNGEQQYVITVAHETRKERYARIDESRSIYIDPAQNTIRGVAHESKNALEKVRFAEFYERLRHIFKTPRRAVHYVREEKLPTAPISDLGEQLAAYTRQLKAADLETLPWTRHCSQG